MARCSVMPQSYEEEEKRKKKVYDGRVMMVIMIQYLRPAGLRACKKVYDGRVKCKKMRAVKKNSVLGVSYFKCGQNKTKTSAADLENIKGGWWGWWGWLLARRGRRGKV